MTWLWITLLPKRWLKWYPERAWPVDEVTMWRPLLVGAAACVHRRSRAGGDGSRRRVGWRVLGCLAMAGSCRWKDLPREGRLADAAGMRGNLCVGGFVSDAALMRLYWCSMLELLSAISFWWFILVQPSTRTRPRGMKMLSSRFCVSVLRASELMFFCRYWIWCVDRLPSQTRSGSEVVFSRSMSARPIWRAVAESLSFFFFFYKNHN